MTKKIFYSNIIKYLQHKSLKNKWLQNKFKSSNQVYILPIGSQSQHSYQESKAFVREKWNHISLFKGVHWRFINFTISYKIEDVRTQFVTIPNWYWVRTLKVQTIKFVEHGLERSGLGHWMVVRHGFYSNLHKGEPGVSDNTFFRYVLSGSGP